MSMEAYALCPRAVSDVSEWQAAIDALGFELRLQTKKIPPATEGHLPATWRGQEAGFECSVIPLSEMTETYPTIDFSGPWTCVYAFYFSTFPACAGALMAIAACVRLTGGIAFSPHDDRLMSVDQAIDCARDIAAQVAGMDLPQD